MPLQCELQRIALYRAVYTILPWIIFNYDRSLLIDERL